MIRKIRKEDLLRKNGDEKAQDQPHKRYLIQTREKADAKAKRLLHVLGAGDAIGEITFSAELTSVQAERLSQQPWIGALEEEQIMRALGTDVVRGDSAPKQTTFGVYAHKRPTKAQGDILYLLGADVSDLSVRAFEVALTPLQVERLSALKWVKQVAPSVQFHTMTPDAPKPVPMPPPVANFAKIDASLAAELQNRRHPDSKDIDLFINTFIVPNGEQVEYLKSLGVNGTDRKTTLFSGKLSQNQIAELSNKLWVKALRGSNRVRPS